MGKGDRRTRRGKIWRGTTGKRRLRQKVAERVIERVTVAPPPKPEKRKKR